MIQFVGFIGAIAYVLSGFSQALLSIKNGHSRGVSRGCAFLTIMGAVLSLIYAFPRGDIVLILNFSSTLIIWGIILKYSYFERKQKAS